MVKRKSADLPFKHWHQLSSDFFFSSVIRYFNLFIHV